MEDERPTAPEPDRNLDALIESERLYRLLAENTGDLITRHTPDGVILYASPACRDMLGYEPEEFVGQDAFELTHPEDREAIRSSVLDLNQQGRLVLEFRLATREGSYIWVETTFSTLPTRPPDETCEIVAVTRDISRRKQAELLLAGERRALEMISRGALLSDVLDLLCRLVESQAPDVLCSVLLLTEDGRHLEHGAAPSLPPSYMQAIDGGEIGPKAGSCGTAAFLGKPVIVTDIATDPLWVDYRDLAAAYDLAACWSTPIFSSEGRVLGTFAIYTRVPREPARDELGLVDRFVHLAGIAIERALSEMALRESEEQYRLIAENVFDLITIHGLDGSYQYVSPASRNLLDYEPEELMRTSSYTLFHPDDVEAVRSAHVQTVAFPGVISVTYRIRKRNGQYLWFETVCSAVRDSQTGEPLEILAVSRDITERTRNEEERRRLDAEMQQAQKDRSVAVLAGGIAHDFNNLLVGILGNSELMLMQLPEDSDLRAPLKRVVTAALRAADLTRQILAYAGKGMFVVEAVDLSEVVREMSELLVTAVAGKAEYRFELASDLPTIDVDATQLRQIVMNLITNAAEAAEGESGTIVLRTALVEVDPSRLEPAVVGRDLPAAEYVSLEVSDNGEGMDDETKQRIFEPFFSTKFQGRGLGLAAVLGIVRGHKGILTVESERGRGTTFRVMFPKSNQRPMEVPAVAHEQAAASRPPSIRRGLLIIDDDEAVRGTAHAHLEQFDYRIFEAERGDEGIDIYAQNEQAIDLVLLDLTMPRMSGGEVLERLRLINPNVPVILMSGYGEQEARASIPKGRLAGFVQKPFRLSELDEAVRAVLDRTAR